MEHHGLKQKTGLLFFFVVKYFITCHKIFHYLPQNISLPATKYFITCHKIFHYLPQNIPLPATKYSITCHKIFHYLPQNISLPATKYFITCHKIAEADGRERDERVVEAFDKGPAFKVHENASRQEQEDDETRYQIQNDISHHTSSGLKRLRLVPHVYSDQLQCFVSDW
jgi:hypothetical protein